MTAPSLVRPQSTTWSPKRQLPLAVESTLQRPCARVHQTEDDDKWQKGYLSGDRLRELNFWLGT